MFCFLKYMCTYNFDPITFYSVLLRHGQASQVWRFNAKVPCLCFSCTHVVQYRDELISIITRL